MKEGSRSTASGDDTDQNLREILHYVAARPEERDEEEDGRHFGRNDRWLLGQDNVVCCGGRVARHVNEPS